MNVGNLAALVNAEQTLGSERWEIAHFAASGEHARAGGAVFARTASDVALAAAAGALVAVCREELSAAARAQEMAVVAVGDLAAALARLARLEFAGVDFYAASALEAELAAQQGYAALSGDIFEDFTRLSRAKPAVVFCADAEYLERICAPQQLPAGEFYALRAGSLFYEDIELCGRFYPAAPLCHLLNAPFARVYAAAAAAGAARPLRPQFEAVFVDENFARTKQAAAARAVIFAGCEVAAALAAAGVAVAANWQQLRECGARVCVAAAGARVDGARLCGGGAAGGGALREDGGGAAGGGALRVVSEAEFFCDLPARSGGQQSLW